jgi:hypothetical protein
MRHQKDSSGIDVITYYEGALYKFNNVAPIKGNGKNAGIRPLGMRNKSQFQILMWQDGSVACRLYKTDVVVFNKDDTISINCTGYNTQTTARFISEVLGVSARVQGGRLVVSIVDGTYLADGLMLRQKRDVALYEVMAANQDTVHSLDRKAMGKLRRQTQDYRTYLTGFMKLIDYTLTDEDLNQLDLENTHRLTLDLWRTDPMHEIDRFKQFRWMIEGERPENWHFSALWLCASSRFSPWDRRFDPRQVMKLLDDILIALNPQVLVPKQLEVGVVTPDPYARFKPFMDAALHEMNRIAEKNGEGL